VRRWHSVVDVGALDSPLALGPEHANLPRVILPRVQNMADSPVFEAGAAVGAGLPWLKSATVSLWRRLPVWSRIAATWAGRAVMAIAYVFFLVFVTVMVLYAVYIMGSLVIYIRHRLG
jgi:hypothetical protein